MYFSEDLNDIRNMLGGYANERRSFNKAVLKAVGATSLNRLTKDQYAKAVLIGRNILYKKGLEIFLTSKAATSIYKQTV